MLPSTPAASPSRWPFAALIGILLLGIVGIVNVTIDDIVLDAAAPASQTLSIDEKAYYDFVEPRLARLSEEVNAVAEMVDGKSRDIIDLTVRGDRISTLTAEILEHGETTGVPERFAGIHRNITQGAEVVTATFDEARASLRTFNFSNMTTLVPQFHRAADILTTAHRDLVGMATGPNAGGLLPLAIAATSAPC